MSSFIEKRKKKKEEISRRAAHCECKRIAKIPLTLTILLEIYRFLRDSHVLKRM